MTTIFNLKTADREAERLRHKSMGLWATHWCMTRFAETKDKFFLETGKAIAQDFKRLDNLLKHG